MSPLPTQMRDRWQNRADTPPDRGAIYWHILMGRYPEARSAAERIQKQLVEFCGLHMTPLDWLHMTALAVGTTDEITTDQMRKMLELASRSLEITAPIDVTLGRVLYHPEAIMLGVEPAGALNLILDAARGATQEVLGRDGVMTSGPGTWVPHMTLCYSTADQAAKPIIDTVGLKAPDCKVTISALALVIQWGPERDWNWKVFGVAPLNATYDH